MWKTCRPNAPSLAPVVHRLERDDRQPLVDRELRHPRVLHQVRPAPQHLAVAELPQVLELGLGQQHDIGCRDDLLARREAPDERAGARRPRRRSARRSPARRSARARSSSGSRSKWPGWIGTRRSSGLREVPITPRVSPASVIVGLVPCAGQEPPRSPDATPPTRRPVARLGRRRTARACRARAGAARSRTARGRSDTRRCSRRCARRTTGAAPRARGPPRRRR